LRGLAYEKKILRALQVFFGEHALVIERPWIEFQDAAGWGICQPDALIIPNNEAEHAVIIEIKLTHKAGAEGKLREFYGPLIARAFKGRRWKFAQVFRNCGRGGDPSSSMVVLIDFERLVGADYEYTTCQFRG